MVSAGPQLGLNYLLDERQSHIRKILPINQGVNLFFDLAEYFTTEDYHWSLNITKSFYNNNKVCLFLEKANKFFCVDIF